MHSKMNFIEGIEWLPSSATNRPKVPVRFRVMTSNDAEEWHNNVQPEIIRESNTFPRADSGWNWRLNFIAFSPKSVSIAFGFVVSRYVFEAQDRHKKGWHPISMISVLKKVPALDNHNKLSIYLWFLSTAPKSLLQTWFGQNEPKLVGTASVVFSILLSLQYKYDGRIGLHATPKGGNRLVSFYGNQVGLMQLLGNMDLPPHLFFLGRVNDNRYFFSDYPCARKIILKFYPYLKIRSISVQ